MFQVPLATGSSSLSLEKFWNIIMLYHDRPHLVNRKLIAVSQCLFCQVFFNSNSAKLQELFNRPSLLYELRKLDNISKENIGEEFLMNLIKPYDKNVHIEEVSLDEFKDHLQGVFVSIRILYPKFKNSPRGIEAVVLDKTNNKITFVAVSDTEKFEIAPPFPYQMELSSFCLSIKLQSFEDADTAHAEWLVDKLFTKLLKWAESINDNQTTSQSLSLVKVDDYCETYNALKEKYADKLVKEWPKKSGTDPQKYAFEDIAIASYLICLWRVENNIKFVDCGCGNGLLVFLLNQEGYQGYGLDIRRRPIWDIYPKSTDLQVKAVTPDDIFPDCTWIIGNHSDELTPWLPVMALRSSPNTKFFVLPCCPYDFNGKKFIRTNTSVSTYTDYLNYIFQIAEKCGFKTDYDKLRIPSTKRTCLIGSRVESANKTYEETLKDVEQMVKSKVSETIILRDTTEKVRNCTKLERNLITTIVKCCVEALLANVEFIKKANGQNWNRGTSLQIQDLVKAIKADDLKQLKKECGGLQTLLRNHRYLFELKNGVVKLRLPVNITETSKYKNKPCWFQNNHPDGCLFDDVSCGYQHQ